MGNCFTDDYGHEIDSHHDQYSTSNLRPLHNDNHYIERTERQSLRSQGRQTSNRQIVAAEQAKTQPIDHRSKLHLELIKEFGDPYRCIAFAGSQATGKTELVRALTSRSKPKHSKTIPSATVYPAFEILGPNSYIYDLIGANTADAYSGEYVQHLEGFDVVFVVMGNRITEIDHKIAKFCSRNSIPCYCIRSKTDVDLVSIMEEQGKTLEEAKSILSNDVRTDFARWASQSRSVANLVNRLFLVTRKYWTDPKEYKQYGMDEKQLIEMFKQMSNNNERSTEI